MDTEHLVKTKGLRTEVASQNMQAWHLPLPDSFAGQ